MGPVRSDSGIKGTMAPTLVGMMEAVSKPETHSERLKQVAALVDEANRKAAGALSKQAARTQRIMGQSKSEGMQNQI